MSSVTWVVRPVVRQFKEKYAREAAAHVRAGGHAIVFDEGSKTRARLVVKIPDPKDPMDLGYWSLLDLGKHRFSKPTSGPLKGLATTRIARDSLHVIERRIERDAGWPKATRKVGFDCLLCGACCRDNQVVLDDDDVARFTKGGRPELARPPYAKKDKEGRVVLTLLKSKDCRHLGKDNKCGVYTLRPSACSEFPVASECCLYAREEEMGVYDGIAPGE